MDLPETDCPELTHQTADAIDDTTLHELFVSTQMNNLDLCVRCALQSVVHSKCNILMLTLLRHILPNDTFDWVGVIRAVFTKFPHFWVSILAKHVPIIIKKSTGNRWKEW